ncbi:isochorismatase family protein [Streptomyces cacaoi]
MTEDTREGTAPVQALVVVDVQTAFVSGAEAVPDARRIRENTALLRERAHRAGAPDEPGTPGWRLHLPPAEGECVLRKTVDDGFEETDLRERLDAAGVRALAVCGVLSEMCVSATARTALRLGYRVVLPHDAHATYDVPAAEDISGVVPAAMAARAAEWALGDEIEIVPFARDVRFTAG